VAAFKDEFKSIAPLFAAQMACNGFVATRVDVTCSVRVKDVEIKFGDARLQDFSFEKNKKGDIIINPRRVCMSYANAIRKLIERDNIVTSTMKRYGSMEPYLFIGGQESVKSVEEARKLVEIVRAVDGPEAGDKLVKYFMARQINLFK
jgi:hypothetical protein